MKRILLLFLTAFVFIAAAEEWQLPTEKPAFNPTKGAELAQANCLMCHSHDYISTQPPLTREQWKASVKKMQDKYGAPILPESVEPLVEYLAASYGK